MLTYAASYEQKEFSSTQHLTGQQQVKMPAFGTVFQQEKIAEEAGFPSSDFKH